MMRVLMLALVASLGLAEVVDAADVMVAFHQQGGDQWAVEMISDVPIGSTGIYIPDADAYTGFTPSPVSSIIGLPYVNATIDAVYDPMAPWSVFNATWWGLEPGLIIWADPGPLGSELGPSRTWLAIGMVRDVWLYWSPPPETGLWTDYLGNPIPASNISYVYGPGEYFDEDADSIPDRFDNCYTIPNGPHEDSQADQDGDGVGDACDNCVEDYNPRARGAYPAVRTITGNQLDDDADGYGNACDAKFSGTPGPVNGGDTIEYKTAINKLITLSTCGSSGTTPCDQFDLDGRSPVITALDTIRFKQLLNQPVGPKCPSCPLECLGDACP